MRRAFVFFLFVALVAWGAVLLAEHPGAVTLEFGGWRVDTSFAVLLVIVAAIAALTALVYRGWLFLRRAPKNLDRAWQAKRRRQGYRALTRGMVAVAAGDADEARRQARRADALLDEPPLTMLVSAQAAQMNGDDKAAEKFFAAMTERPETEFLGVRGLMGQAMTRGDTGAALALARRAYRLKPKSAWVASRMFDLQAREGLWLDARVTCDDLVRHRLLDGAEARRRKAVLNHQLGLEAERAGNTEEAIAYLSEARKLAPGFAPAVTALARLLAAEGKLRRAAALVEEAWAAEPHPDLLGSYLAASQATSAIERVRATQRLARRQPDHPETRIALARASLEARLWGEARRHLEAAVAAAGARPPARACRMMAELEESETGDGARAREWLMRASLAAADPAWVCDDCGNAVGAWSALCGNCGAFDSFAWRTPPSIASLPEADRTQAPALPNAGVKAG
jgi:HemY protein